MSETTDQTLARLRAGLVVVEKNIRRNRARVNRGDASPALVRRMVVWAEDASDFRRAIAALTVGKVRTV